MTDNTKNVEEVNILDLLLVIVDYWRLILLSSVFAAAVTFYFSSQGEGEYYSTAKIPASAPQVETWLQSHTEPTDHLNGFSVSSDTMDSTTVTFRAPSAQLVMEELTSFVETASAALLTERRLPLETALATLDSRIDDLEALADEAKSVSIRLQKEQPLDGEAVASLLQLLQILQTERFQAEREIQGIQDALSQLQHAADFAPVSTPTKIKGSNPYILSSLAALGAGLAMLLLAFLHYGVRRAASDPENAAKLRRLRAALVFWRTKSS